MIKSMDGKVFLGFNHLQKVWLQSNECIDEVFENARIAIMPQMITDSCNNTINESQACDALISLINNRTSVENGILNQKIVDLTVANRVLEQQMSMNTKLAEERETHLNETIVKYRQELADIKDTVAKISREREAADDLPDTKSNLDY